MNAFNGPFFSFPKHIPKIARGFIFVIFCFSLSNLIPYQALSSKFPTLQKKKKTNYSIFASMSTEGGDG